MNKYKISNDNNQSFVELEYSYVINKGDKYSIVSLPNWRPGRYELGNFAKNIQKFEVFDENKNNLNFIKISKNKWKIFTNNTSEILIKYNYYAVELNSGSTYSSEDVLYCNPVNCFLYREDNFQQCILEFTDKYNKIACGESQEGNILKFDNYDHLFDSPFLLSDNILQEEFEINKIKIKLNFWGEYNLDINKIKKDFSKFINAQIESFGSFPQKSYDFIFIFLTYNAYHGVEHRNSTIITLGSSYTIMNRKYDNLLGISSHEFYHSWNIKNIIPKDLHPYDYNIENYTNLGYIAEGVTTYMGDLYLVRSKVWNQHKYLHSLSDIITKYFRNQGRNNNSLATSSFDTWLDGYTLGIPHRKVSIYNEGACIAFFIDIILLSHSNNKISIIDFMKKLYINNKIYNQEEITDILSNFVEFNFQEFFDKYVYNTNSYMPMFNYCFEKLGLKLIVEKEKLINMQNGFILLENKIIDVLDNSNANIVGLKRNDKIIGINNINISNDLNEWLEYFYQKQNRVELTILRENNILKVLLNLEDSKEYYSNYKIIEHDKDNKYYKKWLELR